MELCEEKSSEVSFCANDADALYNLFVVYSLTAKNKTERLKYPSTLTKRKSNISHLKARVENNVLNRVYICLSKID